MTDSSNEQKVRLDKWLWAARFFKTRTLAAEAVNGGRVHLNDARSKPSKSPAVGDTIVITKGTTTWTVVVLALSDKRRGASEARALYEETAESIAARERLAAEVRANPLAKLDTPGRPTKRDRRRMEKVHRKRR